MERSQALATKLEVENPGSDAALIRAAWKQVLSREPNAGELSRALEFLKSQTQNTGGRHQSLVELVRALFNLNEFLYVD